MDAGNEAPHSAENEDDDVRRLHALGYAQELARRLGGFSNFALSLSIICILAGGVTSFHLGLCSVGGASIGLGWPLVAFVRTGGCGDDGTARFDVSDGRWALPLGGDSGRPRLGVDHGLVQPRWTDHGTGRDQRRHVSICAGCALCRRRQRTSTWPPRPWGSF